MSLDREHLLYENLWHDWSGNGRDMRLYGFDYRNMGEPGGYSFLCDNMEVLQGGEIYNQSRYSIGVTKTSDEDLVIKTSVRNYNIPINDNTNDKFQYCKFYLNIPEGCICDILFEKSNGGVSESYSINSSGIKTIQCGIFRYITFTIKGGPGDVFINALPQKPNSLFFGYYSEENIDSPVSSGNDAYPNSRGYTDIPEDMYDMSAIMVRGWMNDRLYGNYQYLFSVSNKTSPSWYSVLSEAKNEYENQSPNVTANGKLTKIQHSPNGFLYLTSESYNGTAIERGTHVSDNKMNFAGWYSEDTVNSMETCPCYFSEFALFNRIVTQEEIQTIKEFWQQLRGGEL